MKTHSPRSAKDIPLLLAAMVVVIMLGCASYFTDGMSYRLSPEVLSFALTGDETSKFWRRGECLLLPDQGSDAFKPDCVASGEHPRILLWGDSYAAAVAQGFVQLANTNHFSVGWLTSSACPPFIGFGYAERPFCKGNNDWVMETIRKNPPDIVILFATWSYDRKFIEDGLTHTVGDLHSAGVKKIIVMGPVSGWKGQGLSHNFVEYYLHSGAKLMPKYSFYKSTYESTKKTEVIVRTQAEALGVRYVSPLSVMCNEQGCLTRVGEHDEMLSAYDTGHLTVLGATYVVKVLLPKILE